MSIVRAYICVGLRDGCFATFTDDDHKILHFQEK